MISDGGYVDGSWQLKILIDDLMIEKTLRVQGDWNVGGVMFKLVECIEMKMNWSDHALWWPGKNRWLVHTRSTLDQYGVQADARLRFLKMHNNLQVQLPDLQNVELRVNFAKNVFGVVIQMCKDLGVRHPEELSLMRRLAKEDMKRSRSVTMSKRNPSEANLDSPTGNNGASPSSPFGGSAKSPTSPGSSWTTPRNPISPLSGTIPRTPYSAGSPNSGNPNYMTLPSPGSPMNASSPMSMYMTHNGGSNSMVIPNSLNSLAFEGAEESLLARSPDVSAVEAFENRGVHRPKNYIQRARINSAWLDSSKSLMEQGLDPSVTDLTVLLRFKYAAFYDLNPKYDSIRINQLYQQARWCLLSEELECTEEEMMVFAALQLQIKLQMNQPQPDDDHPEEDAPEDEIDAILDQLTLSLEGSNSPQNALNEVHQVPELSNYLKYFKPRKFSLKHYRKYWMVLKDTTIRIYKSEEVCRNNSSDSIESLQLRGCEIQADVNLTTHKLGIKLFIPCNDTMQEVWLRCQSEENYADWTAAVRLASRGKTLASKALYDSERQTTLTFLRLQAPKAQPVITEKTMPRDLNVADFVAHRYVKKSKTKSLLESIFKAHGNVRQMSLLDAMQHYIKAWQRLPQHGIAYVMVRFQNNTKNELVGIAYNRIMRMDMNTGETLNTWRFSEMRSWHVNWEVKEMILNFTRDSVSFHPVSTSCKTVHELVGGYIFLSMRTPEKNQELDEAQFHKFTGGR